MSDTEYAYTAIFQAPEKCHFSELFMTVHMY